MTKPKAKHILIAPLDWGLGHTSRCIPMIRYIQRLGHTPIVAGNEWQRLFIEKNFNDINFIHLDGYNVTYTGWNRYIPIGPLSQLPRLLKIINKEHKWLLQKVNELPIDGIISDNRYGLYNDQVPNVILTHQLQVQTGMGEVMNHIVQRIHYSYLNRFGETWVVDQNSFPNLSGKLGHTELLPERTKYIGLLSQFEEERPHTITNGSLLILLSGPEPQRSILSGILWRQVQEYKGKVIFIEGNNAVREPLFIPAHITYHKWLAKEFLTGLMKNAELVVCRSGYSTVMDLIALHKKAILIPTPGQTEQEYLGKYLQEQGIFYSVPQKRFNLRTVLMEATHFPYHQPDIKNAYSGYKEAIGDWIQQL